MHNGIGVDPLSLIAITIYNNRLLLLKVIQCPKRTSQ